MWENSQSPMGQPAPHRSSAEAGTGRVARLPLPRRPVSFSVVIEWDNARLSELGRTHRMLAQLAAQLAALDPARFFLRQVLFAFDRTRVQRELVEGIVRGALSGCLRTGRLGLLATDCLGYYELKNAGARRCDGEVVVFLDSDIVPEDGWLRRLLGPFRDPRIRVVAGSAYIEPQGFYSKAVALWWFFPLRDAHGGLRPTNRFFANNIAFRRELFLATGFPRTATFRGQCILLANRLRRSGVQILERRDARVAHPPPNGGWHFVCRALCEGHDNALLAGSGREPAAASWRASWKRLRSLIAQARARVRRNRAALGLGPLAGAGATLLACAYYLLGFCGERIALRRPGIIRKYFPV